MLWALWRQVNPPHAEEVDLCLQSLLWLFSSQPPLFIQPVTGSGFNVPGCRLNYWVCQSTAANDPPRKLKHLPEKCFNPEPGTFEPWAWAVKKTNKIQLLKSQISNIITGCVTNDSIWYFDIKKLFIRSIIDGNDVNLSIQENNFYSRMIYSRIILL